MKKLLKLLNILFCILLFFYPIYYGFVIDDRLAIMAIMMIVVGWIFILGIFVYIDDEIIGK